MRTSEALVLDSAKSCVHLLHLLSNREEYRTLVRRPDHDTDVTIRTRNSDDRWGTRLEYLQAGTTTPKTHSRRLRLVGELLEIDLEAKFQFEQDLPEANRRLQFTKIVAGEQTCFAVAIHEVERQATVADGQLKVEALAHQLKIQTGIRSLSFHYGVPDSAILPFLGKFPVVSALSKRMFRSGLAYQIWLAARHAYDFLSIDSLPPPDPSRFRIELAHLDLHDFSQRNIYATFFSAPRQEDLTDEVHRNWIAEVAVARQSGSRNSRAATTEIIVSFIPGCLSREKWSVWFDRSKRQIEGRLATLKSGVEI